MREGVRGLYSGLYGFHSFNKEDKYFHYYLKVEDNLVLHYSSYFNEWTHETVGGFFRDNKQYFDQNLITSYRIIDDTGARECYDDYLREN